MVEPIFRIVTGNRGKKTEPERNVQVTNTSKNLVEESRQRGDLFVDEKKPVWHKISNPMLTPSIIAQNLSLQFKDLPIFGAPDCSANLEQYEDKKIREFVGFDLDDPEYKELIRSCNPANLKTGKEIKMDTNYPVMGLVTNHLVKADDSDDENDSDIEQQSKEPELYILQKLRKRKRLTSNSNAMKLLKYRGIKQFLLREQEEGKVGLDKQPPDLEPGKDVLYRIRVFRPFTFQLTGEKHVRGRHSVFQCDIVMPGRQLLTELRELFLCRNDLGMRRNLSHDPFQKPDCSAKTRFPSGFFFINNVFYVDGRPGCRDMSAVVRRWAEERGLGTFPARAMEHTRMDETLARLAHPEVYVHQGSCEHVFLVSEVRLLNRSDPLHLSTYPCHTHISQNQSIYCTTCAEFGAKWLVTGSDRVPFDPAFFCEACFKHYQYKAGRMIGDFKAYQYKGNQVNAKNLDFGGFV